MKKTTHAFLLGSATVLIASTTFLVSPKQAQAAIIWDWSVTDSFSQISSGTFTTGGITPIANSTYAITAISGISNINVLGQTIVGLSNFVGADNTFQWDGTGFSPILVDGDGISWLNTDGGVVNIYLSSGIGYGAVTSTSTNYDGSDPAIVSSSLSPRVVTAVPEPSSILGLLALGTLGAGSALKRRLK